MTSEQAKEIIGKLVEIEQGSHEEISCLSENHRPLKDFLLGKVAGMREAIKVIEEVMGDE